MYFLQFFAKAFFFVTRILTNQITESVHWTGIANLKMTAGDFELKSREWRDVHSYQSFNFQANIWKSEEAGNGSGLMCGCAKVADEGFLMKCNCNRKYPFVCETKDFY